MLLSELKMLTGRDVVALELAVLLESLAAGYAGLTCCFRS
jgi:hypothetical protein